MYKANTSRVHEARTARKLLTIINENTPPVQSVHHENEEGDIDLWLTKRLFVLNILAKRNYNLREYWCYIVKRINIKIH